MLTDIKRTYIIAEAGVNHNGSLENALKLVDEAKGAGADCVKFQTFKAEQIVTEAAPKAAYQLEVTDRSESQFDMLKKLELKFEDYPPLIKRCAELGIDFLSTPYNKEDADFLDQIGVDGFKIASGQLTELPLLRYIGSKKKRMIISTGMATMAEVFDAVQSIREVGNNNIQVLQCTTNYPSHIQDANLLAMNSIKEACKVTVGYSDHVENNYACFAAVALGAEIIEKHFTLSKSMPGPDHSSSLEPVEFKILVEGIRNIEIALGDGLKVPSAAEIKNTFGMKRSLVALKEMEAGAEIKVEDIGFKRPANGMSPNMMDLIVGKRLKKRLSVDEAFDYSSIEW